MTKRIYNDESIEIKEPLDHIRESPTMYIGYIGINGILKMIRELLDNSIDEMEAGYCTSFSLIYDISNNIYISSDDGPGIPVRSLRNVTTLTGCGAKFNSSVYVKKVGLNGVGMKIIAALSTMASFTSVSYNADKDYNETVTVFFKDGKFIKESMIKKTNDHTGVTVTFSPDVSVLKNVDFPPELIIDYLKSISYIIPNRKFTMIVKPKGSEIYNNHEFISRNGMTDALDSLLGNKSLYEPIHIKTNNGAIECDVLFTHDPTFGERQILSYGNNAITFSHGSHVKGFIKTLQSFISRYIKDNLMKEKEKSISILEQDISYGLKAVINVAFISDKEKPLFQGQAKEELTNESAYKFMAKVTNEFMEQWAMNNPTDCKKLGELIKKVAKNRENNKKSNKNVVSKITSNFSKNMPDKFVPANDLVECELYLAEGDSAKGGLKNSRFPNQAIMPLKGVSKNTFNMTSKQVYANATYNDLITILGTGIGDDFNMKKCKYSKVIIATDADVDGLNIARLLLAFFIRHMPQLILAGMVYVLITPLYAVDGKHKYLYNKKEYNTFKLKKVLNSNTITDVVTGDNLSNSKIINMITELEPYYTKLTNISNRYKVPKYLIEALIEYEFNQQAMIDAHIGQDFVCEITTFNTHLELNGIIVDLPSIPRLNRDLYALKELRKGYNFNYLLNDSLSTIGEIITYLDNYTPKVKRFKGLGEMGDADTNITCMNPKTRKLIRMTLNNNVENVCDYLDIIYGNNSDERIKMIQDYDLNPNDIDN